jgi:hypothetical protein
MKFGFSVIIVILPDSNSLAAGGLERHPEHLSTEPIFSLPAVGALLALAIF